MKLSFSTLACPEWSLEEVLNNAVLCKYDGVEFRGIKGEYDLTKLREFTTDIDATKALLNNNNLEVACISTSCFFANPEQRRMSIPLAKEHIDIAAQLNCRVIRVFSGRFPENISEEETIEGIVQGLKDVCVYAEDNSVYVALETHDALTSSALVKDIVERVGSDSMAVLWDIHHTYRECNEAIETVIDTIGKYIVHTHFKDSVTTNGDFTYVSSGTGTIPLKDSFLALKTLGYTGYLSFEWEKAWCKYLAEPEVALPAFKDFVSSWIEF
jgi:sugar phosphate isomerase/epimerase